MSIFCTITRGQKKSKIVLKSTKFERKKIQRCLELLSCTVEGVWKEKESFKINISQENLEKWPESGDIRNLDEVVTIPIAEEIVQSEKSDLEDIEKTNSIFQTKKDDNGATLRNKAYNLYTDGKDAGPSPLQNKDFPEETFEAAIVSSNTKSSNIHDAVIAQKKLEDMLSQNETTAHFKQDNVIPLTDYVDMNKTTFAWARAFPTVFPPEYIDGKWIIRHDITGSVNIRDRNVKQKDWMEYLMWRSDGIPSSHPTFALVLYNHKVRNQLHKLGNVCLNTEDIDPNSDIQALQSLWENDEDRMKLQRKLFTYASNVPGTKPYWVAKCHEFKSTSFYHSYIKKMHPTIFHTGSIAEYHDSWLRILLSRYVSCIDGNSNADGQLVLNNNSHFTSAVQKYKQVVTHFLASKMEIWYNIVMKNIHNVVDAMITKEFASSRGAIHYHSLNYTDQLSCIEIKMDKCLVTLSLSLYKLFVRLDSFIDSNWEKSILFEKNPTTIRDGKEGYKTRECFLKSFEEGISYWNNFKIEEAKEYEIHSFTLSNILESTWGYGAMHPGTFPNDWVAPSGMEEDGYPSTSDHMLSSINVLDSAELKKLKINREENLLNRAINYINHCGTHKCSKYCHLVALRNVKYNKNKHKDVKEDDIFSKDGDMFARIKVIECRMKFGKLRIFDKSGENNLTRGIAIRSYGSIICDINGQPRFHARRNHPRILQQPHTFLYYGGNNDTQRLLSNRTGYETCKEKGINYENFLIQLNIHGCVGFEQYTASHLIENYICKYTTKGGSNSDNWEVSFKSICKDYTDNGNLKKTARSVYAKYMIEIMKAESKTQDECVYLLAGGTLTTNTVQTKKCSVTSTDLDNFKKKNDVEESESCISKYEYTWSNILRRYKGRSTNLDHLNLYKFVVFHFYKDQVIHPQFFGYHKVVNYPPTEYYSKIMLTLYKPWKNSIKEILDNPKDTYSSHLISYMYDENFPKPILMDLLRVKIAMRYSKTEERNFGIVNDHTPTENRNNEVMAGVEESVREPIDNINIEQCMDLGEEALLQLNDGGVDKDWSTGYNEEHDYCWITKMQKQMKESIVDSSTMTTIEYEKYNPTNIKSKSQKIIIFNHIYQHYIFQNINSNEEIPPSMNVKIQGLPGTGKTFIANTIRNIDIRLFPNSICYSSCAPTGCAASLINGQTHHKLFNIPVGKKFMKQPVGWTETNASVISAKFKYWSTIFTLLMDEDSMAGRPFWAWFKQRIEEFRKVNIKIDDEYNVHTMNHKLTHPKLSTRIYGGIPAFYSMGDINQLPPVFMKSIADDSQISSNNADGIGKYAFSDFMNPPDSSETINYTFHMTDVIRQNDEEFKNILSSMRKGTLITDQCTMLTNRCLSKLDNSSLKIFDDAIHLVNQWRHGISPTITYLNKLGTPVCKILPSYSSIMTTKVINHCVKESNFPKLTAINVGCKVMLLMNIIPDFKLINGSIGTVIDIIYKDKNGPRQIPYQLPTCVIVDFNECVVDEEFKWRNELPSTHIPIIQMSIRCEKQCCTVTSIPLRVCKALTIHKSQGMSVGPGHPFESAVIYLPEKGEKTNPGSELVATSRVTDISFLAICDTNRQVTVESLKKIGSGNSYNKRKKFDEMLQVKDSLSRQIVEENITKLDDVSQDEIKTFTGGCNFLLKWYNEKSTIND